MAHEGKRHSFAGSGNTSIAALLKKNETNNENLFKLMRSEPSHINQINSATADFNTVMKNYGTFSDKTWKRKVADEKARVDAFTSMSDDTSQTQLTDFDAKTKLKREKTAKNKAVIDERLGQYNFNNALFRDGIETGTEVGNQTKLVAEEKGSLVLNENSGIQTTASGQHLDPIGREINQLTTDVGQESYRQLNTDDVAFAAQKSFSEVVTLEKAVLTEKAEHIDSHKYNRDRKGQIITDTPAHNQLHSEVTPTVEDYTITGTAQKAIIADEKLTKDMKELAIEAKKLANAAELNAEKDASAALVAESLALSQENLKQSGIDESALEREQEITKRIKKIKKEEQVKSDAKAELEKIKTKTAEIEAENAINQAEAATRKKQAALDKIAENKRLVADANENQEKNAALAEFNRSREGSLDYVAGGDTTGSASTSSQSQYELANQKVVTVAKDAEIDAINNTTIKDMTTTVREIEAERAEKERLFNEQINNPTSDDIAEKGQLQIAKEKERQEKIAQKIAQATQTSGLVGSQGNEQKITDELRQERQFNNADANADFSKTDTSPDLSGKRGTGGKDRGAFRKLQAEKKAAKARADAAESQSEMPSANGPTSRSSRGFRMKRGDANDPYHFTTLAYPPDAVNSQENGHFMLFYVNVQNKTKYEYNGYKNGNVVPVGGQVGTRIDGVPAQENLGYAAVPAKTVYTNDARESGLVTDVEYQKQMIRNGGKGNIIYNNQKVLQKSRKSPGQNLASKYPTTTRITDSVALYLPSGIGNSTSVTYGDFETGIAGYAVMSGIDFGKSIQEEDFVGAATQLFDKSKTLIKDAVKNLTLKGLETLGGGEGLTQNFDKIFGQTLNPYIEVAFSGTGMRTFDYTFKFAPKSRAETDEVQAIINLFRFHMLPEMKGTSSRYLTLPSTFDIHYMWQSGVTAAKENSFYNKIATCVLTNVDVNYTPNGEVQSFGDGAPTETSMRLSFKETEMMTKQHVNEGF